WRWAAGWALALAGPAALGGGLATTRSEHSNATELMGFLTLSVAVALVGGLLPALVAAVLGSAILNYFFTPPRYTWKIAEPEQELALIVFVLVAAAVASVVDLAERRRQQADRSRAESETLSLLAGSVLRGEDSVAAVLGRLRETFAAPGAALEERDPGGVWHPVETSGQVAGDAREVVEVGPTLRLVLCTGTLSDDDRRVVTAFASHAGVVLERERLRARAAEAHRLEQGIAVRTALLAAVSHDLRTPLAAIRAASSSLLLRDVEWSPRDRDELVETVADGAERLQALIDNLLDLSRLQAGVVQPVLSPVALDEVVGPALDGVDDGAVHVDVPDDLPLVRTDAGLLERVLANLLENAVRHATDAPQPVSLTARPADGELEVLVVDHGPGVPDEAKQQVFEPFQRLDDATARGGAGLGLAVARGLATAVGGRLAARDTPGGGLTMALRLPVA
ncbi:MAG: DUF4118 domain-containing protein, partial [Actinomycetes bacterium]